MHNDVSTTEDSRLQRSRHAANIPYPWRNARPPAGRSCFRNGGGSPGNRFYLNGQSCGVVWESPFRVEITDAVKPGANELVVEVANTWSNRLVGDARTEGKDYCRTNIAKSLTWSVPWKDTPLLESGLLGPVRLMMTQVQIGRPSP